LTIEEYNRILKETVDSCLNLLTKKKEEYSPNGIFHNFEVAAKLQNTTPEAALGGMLCKHTVSLYDMIKGGIKSYTPEMWNEKIYDHINYLLILKAMVHDEYTAQQGTN